MRPWFVILTVAAAALAACDTPTKPTDTSSPIASIRSVRTRRLLDTIAFTTGAVVGTYTNTPNAGTDEPNAWAVEMPSVGLSVSPYAYFSVYVVGTVYPVANPNLECCFFETAADTSLAGTYIGPGGALDEGSHYEFVATASSPNLGLISGTISSDSSSAGPFSAGGSGYTFGFYRTGTWEADWGCYNNGSPTNCLCNSSCPLLNVNEYSLTGSETETIYRYADQVRLAASTQSGTGPTSISFTVSTSDGGGIIPYPWTWTPDSGTDSTQACSSNYVNPCTTTVYSSGIMSATIYDYGAGRTEQTGLHIVISP
jgi:hypothetical protein